MQITVAQLIEALSKVEDKEMEVTLQTGGTRKSIKGITIERWPVDGSYIGHDEDGIAGFSAHRNMLCFQFGDDETVRLNMKHAQKIEI